MPKVNIEKGAIGPLGDPWSCKDGRPHKFEYRGRRAQEYRCSSCGLFVSKSQLKEMTDNVT